MYIRRLTLEHVKLIERLELAFDQPGAPSEHCPWTVLIGPNGTAKTTILQCIALAAAGSYHAPGIANGLTPRLRDLRTPNATARIDAEFSFPDMAFARPEARLPIGAPTTLRLRSELSLPARKSGFDARSWFEVEGQRYPTVTADPLRDARTDAPPRPLWFVAGYGILRNLPLVIDRERRDPPGIESRLDSLFRPRPLTSFEWANVFYARDEEATAYKVALKSALIREVERLLPLIDDLELRGRPPRDPSPGEVLQFGDRFRWHLPGGDTIPIAATSLSHGYQSTIAWVSDLIGQILHEAEETITPDAMRGLVLVDELDLYLHPRWQVSIIRAIRTIFPKLQFVVTTHSPLLLPSLRPLVDQVVRLEFGAGGSVERVQEEADPRLLTSGQLLLRYFGLEEIFDDEARRLLAEYQALAVDALRSEAEEAHLDVLEDELRRRGVVSGVVRVSRRS